MNKQERKVIESTEVRERKEEDSRPPLSHKCVYDKY